MKLDEMKIKGSYPVPSFEDINWEECIKNKSFPPLIVQPKEHFSGSGIAINFTSGYQINDHYFWHNQIGIPDLYCKDAIVLYTKLLPSKNILRRI